MMLGNWIPKRKIDLLGSGLVFNQLRYTYHSSQLNPMDTVDKGGRAFSLHKQSWLELYFMQCFEHFVTAVAYLTAKPPPTLEQYNP